MEEHIMKELGYASIFLMLGCAMVIIWFFLSPQNVAELQNVEMKLNLYVSYKGCGRCKECFLKAKGFYTPYILKVPLKLKKRQGQQPCIKIVKSDRSPVKLEHFGWMHDHFTIPIHDCGGIEAIYYNMYTEKDYFLHCLPSKDYVNVIVEKHERIKYQARDVSASLKILKLIYKVMLLLDKSRTSLFYYSTGQIFFSDDQIKRATGDYLQEYPF